MAESKRRYNLRNHKAVALLLGADEEAEPLDAPCSDDSGEEFVVSGNETSDCEPADEENIPESEQDDNDGLESKAKSASKR